MSAEPTTPLPSLLLVEDESANRALVRAIAARGQRQGVGPFELVEATCLEEARTLFSKRRFRTVLLDVRLPDGSGLKLAEEIRARPGEQPWIIVMSASVHGADQQRAITAGADLFLGKPIKADHVISILEQVLAEDATLVHSGSTGVEAAAGRARPQGIATQRT